MSKVGTISRDLLNSVAKESILYNEYSETSFNLVVWKICQWTALKQSSIYLVSDWFLVWFFFVNKSWLEIYWGK